MKKLLIAVLLFGCAKTDMTCYDINGKYDLVELVENGRVVCEYDSLFYYEYEFLAGVVYVTQFRGGVDSFVRSFVADCNSVFNRTDAYFYYGSPVSYAVLRK